jgi:hypothetical protein
MISEAAMARDRARAVLPDSAAALLSLGRAYTEA